jgi:hypothetical protein
MFRLASQPSHGVALDIELDHQRCDRLTCDTQTHTRFARPSNLASGSCRFDLDSAIMDLMGDLPSTDDHTGIRIRVHFSCTPELRLPDVGSCAFDVGDLRLELDRIVGEGDKPWTSITAFGTLSGITYEQLALGVEHAEVHAFYKHASNQIHTIAGLLRWRVEDDCKLHELASISLAYLSENGEWVKISTGLHFGIRFGIPFSQSGPTAAELADVQRLVDAGRSEPVAHAVFREAWNQRVSNPRSAIVLGVAALEVGFGHFVSRKEPNAPNVKRKRGSTPVAACLRTILHRYHVTVTRADGQKLVLSPAFLRTLDELAQVRNDIVHDGKSAPPSDQVDEMLRSVVQALWLFDRLTGDEWAHGRINPSIFVGEAELKALKLQSRPTTKGS